jgi:hypothetical protein
MGCTCLLCKRYVGVLVGGKNGPPFDLASYESYNRRHFVVGHDSGLGSVALSRIDRCVLCFLAFLGL